MLVCFILLYPIQVKTKIGKIGGICLPGSLHEDHSVLRYQGRMGQVFQDRFS